MRECISDNSTHASRAGGRSALYRVFASTISSYFGAFLPKNLFGWIRQKIWRDRLHQCFALEGVWATVLPFPQIPPSLGVGVVGRKHCPFLTQPSKTEHSGIPLPGLRGRPPSHGPHSRRKLDPPPHHTSNSCPRTFFCLAAPIV